MSGFGLMDIFFWFFRRATVLRGALHVKHRVHEVRDFMTNVALATANGTLSRLYDPIVAASWSGLIITINIVVASCTIIATSPVAKPSCGQTILRLVVV